VGRIAAPLELMNFLSVPVGAQTITKHSLEGAMKSIEARHLSDRCDSAISALTTKNQMASARNAAWKNKNKFSEKTLSGLDNAPSGFVRMEQTVGTLPTGKRVKMTIFHALYGTERKICTTNDQAQEWVAKRRKEWADTAAKRNAVIKAQAAARVASARLTAAAIESSWALTSGQMALVQRALAAITDATDALRQEDKNG